MDIKNLFKKSKILKQMINIEFNNVEGKKKSVKMTVEELANCYVKVANELFALNTFARIAIKEFYKVAPEHEFFKKCDEKLIAFLKEKEEEIKKGD